jgi:hypothetical protein
MESWPQAKAHPQCLQQKERTEMRNFVVMGTLALAAAVALAVPPPRTLPSFDVTAADGSTAQAAQIARNGKWLLIFVKPHCPQCDTLLASLDSASTQDGSRVAVLVKTGTPNALAEMRARYPHISKAAWYADVHASAARSLVVPASPTTLGMRGTAITWRLTGTISALPTDESSGIVLAGDAAANPRVRERTLVNGWLKQP